MKKPGRNDPCVCGSGKKFKKCCERKMIGKKYMATKIEPQQTASNIVSFFNKKITQIKTVDNTSSENSKPINAEIKKDEKILKENILNK